MLEVAEEVIILHSKHLTSYKGEGQNEALSRILTTSKVEKAKICPKLEPPNVISGLPAASRSQYPLITVIIPQFSLGSRRIQGEEVSSARFFRRFR